MGVDSVKQRAVFPSEIQHLEKESSGEREGTGEGSRVPPGLRREERTKPPRRMGSVMLTWKQVQEV